LAPAAHPITPLLHHSNTPAPRAPRVCRMLVRLFFCMSLDSLFLRDLLNQSRRLRRGFVFAFLFLLAGAAQAAVVFNWPDGGWTAGTPSVGSTVTQNFTNFTPNDITVSVSNNGGPGTSWAGGYPQIDSTSLTGGFTGVDALQLYMTGQDSTTSFIRTTISFASPATNVTFQLWDVDEGNKQFTDVIQNISAQAFGGGTVGADSVTQAVAGFNTITGTGLSTVITGIAPASGTTNEGTITITFNGPITSFSFDWLNTDSKLGSQAIALGPISYAPEVLPTWASAAFCGFAVIAWEIKRRRSRSRR
jgi:hypothetical protein